MKTIASLAKLLVLISVLPLLIGHGMGGTSGGGDAPGLAPDENTYVISGGPDRATPIYTSATLRILADQNEVLQKEGANLPPIVFSRQYYVPSMKLDVYSSSGADSRLGPLWLHVVDKQGASTKVKLLEGSLSGPLPFRFFQANFFVADLKNLSDQSPVMGAPAGGYVLSGGSDIAAPITATGELTVSLDSTPLASQSSATPQSHAPISFSATTGNILTVDLKSYGPDEGAGEATALWLHLPSGEAIKLAHQTLPTTYGYLSAHFVIP